MGGRRVSFTAPMVLLLVLLSKSSASGEGHQRDTKTTPLILNGVGSSFVFPIHGNVYPTGFYNVTMEIGDPPKPYFLDIDTGSDLTWLQCDAPCVQCTESPHALYRPHNNLVACSDPVCASLHESETYTCETPDQCDYEVEYADGGSSIGVLVNDMFLLNTTASASAAASTTAAAAAAAILSFGCGYDQIPGGSNQPLDGVIGLGRGTSSITWQLQKQGIVRNVLGHCLSRRGGGFLFFGDDLYDCSSITWAAMSGRQSKQYSPGPGELAYGGKSTGLRNLFVVFDSGSSYTYLNSVAYKAIAFQIKRELAGKPMREARDDETLPVCWTGKKPLKSIEEVKKFFKPMALSFSSGGKAKARFELLPEDYLILSVKGNVCLGVLNGTEIGLDEVNVIGDVSMQEKLMIYDNERHAIGWTRASCDLISMAPPNTAL